MRYLFIFLICLFYNIYGSELTYSPFSDINFYEFDNYKKAKEDDSTVVKKPKYKRPLISAGLSTFIPGLGQAYNKKIWKVPVVLAIMAIPIYFTIYSSIMKKKALQHYWYLKEVEFIQDQVGINNQILLDPNFVNSQAYKDFLASKPNPPNGISPIAHIGDFGNNNIENMRSVVLDYQTDFETAIVFTVFAHILNILDAFADGYFYKYDVDEKLSIRLEPTTFHSNSFYANSLPGTLIPGLKVNIKF